MVEIAVLYRVVLNNFLQIKKKKILCNKQNGKYLRNYLVNLVILVGTDHYLNEFKFKPCGFSILLVTVNINRIQV